MFIGCSLICPSLNNCGSRDLKNSSTSHNKLDEFRPLEKYIVFFLSYISTTYIYKIYSYNTHTYMITFMRQKTQYRYQCLNSFWKILSVTHFVIKNLNMFAFCRWTNQIYLKIYHTPETIFWNANKIWHREVFFSQRHIKSKFSTLVVLVDYTLNLLYLL